jgi:hypothetical protein
MNHKTDNSDMLIDTRYNLVTPLLFPLLTLNNQYRPPPCCLANIALFISLFHR